MRGSLDAPPIVVFTSRMKAFLFAAGSALFVAVIVEMLASGAIAKMSTFNQFLMYAGLLLFGLGTPLMILRLVRPDRLVLSPDGITWAALLRTRSWRWSEVRDFRPFRVTNFSSHVGFNFTEEYKKLRTMRHVSSYMTGVEGSFGGGWELNPSDLASLLNDAKQRWDQPAVARIA